MPESPSRDTSVTAPCPICLGPMPTGHARSWCSPRCRQAAYRARHRPPSLALTLPSTAVDSRTASGVYECPACGDRLAGERRCQECNLFARRLGEGGCCPACSEIITINELLDIQPTPKVSEATATVRLAPSRDYQPNQPSSSTSSIEGAM